MRQTFLAAAAVLALASPSFAQSTTVTTTPGAGATTVTIAPEQRTRIKQYVVQHNVRPYAMRERIAIGSTLPPDVELSAVPGDWGPGLVQYRYVYSGDSIGLVDPSSRRVIQVIE